MAPQNFKNSRIETNQPSRSSNHATNDSGWSHDLCKCYDDCGECTTGWCLPPVYGYMISLRAGEMPSSLIFGGPHVLRTKIRVERKIKGTIAGDCLYTYCPCTGLCSFVQMGIEAKETKPLL